MTENASAQQNTAPIFNIEKLYVKDLSLEIPNAPAIFLMREAPKTELELQTKASLLEEGIYEVEVMVTVTAKLPDKEQVMFLIEAKQAGIFQIRNMSPAEMEIVLAVMCPNIIYPYLREVVSEMAVRGGFAPLFLNPINFDAIYQQQKQQQTQAGDAAVKH
jgi:preprotein translocase subunit SecB